jgi:hypothetical protein
MVTPEGLPSSVNLFNYTNYFFLEAVCGAFFAGAFAAALV